MNKKSPYIRTLTIFMKMINLNKKGWQWILLSFLAFIWGSSFILMKKGLEVYPDDIVAALRISISFILLIPFAFKHIRRVEKKYWKYLIAIGFLGNGIPAFLFTKAQTEITSALSGMLNSLTPIFALIIGITLFNVKLVKTQLLSVLIGLAGAISLIVVNNIGVKETNLIYTVYVILATVCYAFSVNIIKNYLKEIDAIVITSLAFLSIGPFTIFYLFTTDFIKISYSTKIQLYHYSI